MVSTITDCVCVTLSSYVSVRQGVDVNDGELDLISNIIRKTLKIDCAVMMGANVANDVAQEHFCEATIGIHLYIVYTHTYANILILYSITRV